MKRNWLLAVLSLPVALFLSFLGEPSAAAAEKIVLRLSHGNQVNHIRHKSALMWKELLEKESKGRVEVKIFPASQLYKSTEEISALMMGGLDMVAAHGGPISSLVPQWDIFIMPFFWPNDGKNFDPAWKFKESEVVKRVMIPKLEQKGVKFIGFMTALGGGAEFSTTNRPVKKVSDLKGLKLNTLAGWLRFEAVKALGASCVTMPKSEVGEALAQGTLDGEFSTVSDVLTSGYPVKYIHWWPTWCNDTGAGFLMNMKKWNSLPEDIKKLIDNLVTPETQKWTNKQVLVEEAQSVIELKNRKMIFVDPDPGTLEECAKREQFLWELYEKKFGKDGQEIIRTAKQMMGK